MAAAPSATAGSTSPPEVTLTPATPQTPTQSATLGPPLGIPSTMKEKPEQSPSESETALVGKATAQGTSAASTSTSPVAGLMRKLSRSTSKQGGTGTGGPVAESEKGVNAQIPSTKVSAKSSNSPTNASTSRAAAVAAATAPISRPPIQKKKRKRTGFAGFLLALGCLSASEFEEEPSKSTTAKPTSPTTVTETKPQPKPTATPSTPVISGKQDGKAQENGATKPGDTVAPTTLPPVSSSPLAAQGTTIPDTATAQRVDPTDTTSTTLVGAEGTSTDKAAGPVDDKEADVIVAPSEPSIPPPDETAGMTSSAVQAPGSGSVLLSTPVRPSASRRQSETFPVTPTDAEKTETSGGYSNISESDLADESSSGYGAGAGAGGGEYNLEEEYEDEEDRLIAQGGMGIPLDENGHAAPLLPPVDKVHLGRKCLVLDLDETLLHSSFKMLPAADYIVPVEIESQTHNVYVIKRPGVDHFLTEMGKIYEVVVFTASLSKYADPVLDMLDTGRVVKHRLFRESCYNHKGNYVKDLSQLGRDMETCIIIDNSPASYIFHPNNAVPVSTWFNDPHDTELTDLCPFLADLATVDDIRGVLDGSL